MKIEIANGTFKVMTGVKAAQVVKVTQDDKVVDEFAFATSANGQLTDSKFSGNASTDDGCIAFIREIDTTGDLAKVKEDLKKCYGKALARAAQFESTAIAQCKADDEKAAAEAEAIDELFA